MITILDSLQVLPPWSDDVIFENFVTHYFNDIEETKSYVRYGRSGQDQNGIDIYSHERKTVIQCKLKAIGRDDIKIRKELIASLNKDFKSFVKYKAKNKLPYSKFIFASTFESDTQLDTECVKLSNDDVIVEYWSWDRFKTNMPSQTWELYYGDFFKIDEINRVNGLKDKYTVDKTSPLIDQIYDYLKYYFSEIKILPPYLFKNNYPFKCNSDYIPYYSVFKLYTDNQELYELLGAAKQEDGKLIGIKRKYSEGVKRSKDKVTFILKTLSNNLIFH